MGKNRTIRLSDRYLNWWDSLPRGKKSKIARNAFELFIRETGYNEEHFVDDFTTSSKPTTSGEASTTGVSPQENFSKSSLESSPFKVSEKPSSSDDDFDPLNGLLQAD